MDGVRGGGAGLLFSGTVVTLNRDIELVGELLVDDGGVSGEARTAVMAALLSWTRDT